MCNTKNIVKAVDDARINAINNRVIHKLPAFRKEAPSVEGISKAAYLALLKKEYNNTEGEKAVSEFIEAFYSRHVFSPKLARRLIISGCVNPKAQVVLVRNIFAAVMGNELAKGWFEKISEYKGTAKKVKEEIKRLAKHIEVGKNGCATDNS